MDDDISVPPATDNRLTFGTIDNSKMADASIITSIRAEMDSYHAYIAKKNSDGSARNTRQCIAASQTYLALAEAAATRFGELNGWRKTNRSFQISDIGRQSRKGFGQTSTAIFDHPIFYRADGRCVAIAAQPYDHAQDEAALEVAAANGVACHVPPHPFASFHFPGRTRIFVFTAHDHEIVWLPEMLSGGRDGKYF